MVPKGFIRHHVLEALTQKPMSGSELIEELEARSGGCWKPSPGSIYPLLSWLQDNGHIKELPVENGLKRYELTENGKALLEEQRKILKKFKEAGFFPTSFNSVLMKIPQEKHGEINEAVKRLTVTFFNLGNALQANFSEEALNEALSAVDEASKKFEEITNKLKSDKL
jgi:DNA-binding PadR family transcriptional regulator